MRKRAKGAPPHADDIDGYAKIDRYNTRTVKNIACHFHGVLTELGEDPDREGLAKTPERYAKAMHFLTHGYDLDPSEILRSAMFNEEYRQMVIVKDIELYSLCEHHLLPFIGKAHVAYFPSEGVVGLSKLARVVDVYARRLQTQETMTAQIADVIDSVLKPRGVAVLIEAEHMCMSMRGVAKPGSSTVTTQFMGVFKEDANMQQRFLTLVHSAQK